jgi:hypothetical protein
MKLGYKGNLKKQTPTRIGLILVKLLMIVTAGSKNTFGAIVVHVISAKIGAAGPETPIFAVCVSW